MATLLAAILGRRFSAISRALRRQEIERGAMVEAAHALGDPGGTDRALEKICRHACSIMRVEKAVIFAPSEDDPHSYVALAGHGVPDDMIGFSIPNEQGLAGRVLTTGQAVRLPDYQAFDRPAKHAATADLRASAAAPVRWQGELRGALSVATVRPDRQLGHADLRVLGQLAGLAGVALEQALARKRLERMLVGGAEGLAVAVDLRDSYTAEHSNEVVALARLVGEALRLPEAELHELELAARLHDIGKIGIPDSILRKQGSLNTEEWEEMKCHPIYGERILLRMPGFEAIAKAVRSEHERWDGGGYPDGLRGDEIPSASRIILACDAYHAMTSDRPYRKAMSEEDAREELRRGSGSQFDPTVIDALLEVLAVRSSSRSELGLVGATA